jgi:hypothetical protein
LFHAAAIVGAARSYAAGFWKNLNLDEVFFRGPDVECVASWCSLGRFRGRVLREQIT